MPRYTRQRTRSDCGPVAILNILKWAGFRASYDDHIELIKEAARYKHSENYTGCKFHNLLKAINELSRGKLKAKKYKITDLDVLIDHIRRGNAFILRHGVTPPEIEDCIFYHYTTVVPGENGKFAWINTGGSEGETTIEVEPKEFEQIVNSTRRFADDVPMAILIRKSDRKIP